MRLFKEKKMGINNKGIHKQFLENDLTGIDIMPFAAHISTLNLAMQNIEQPTNLVRIASMDSLSMASDLSKRPFLSGKGLRISGFEHTIQSQLTGDSVVIRKRGAVSMQGGGKGFYLNPVDLVIMNPPFSDREKMPTEMREKINDNKTLNKISGNRVNLWGPFIALSDLLLKKNGKVAAVIPINIARGEATKKVREYLLRNYSTEYIVKPLVDEAFSEGASFKDILFVSRKRKPNQNDYTAIVTIKTSIKTLTSDTIQGIIMRIKNSYEQKVPINSATVEVEFVNTLDLLKYETNLMPMIGFSSSKNKGVLEDFLRKIRDKAGTKLKKMDRSLISEGFHASPSGLSELVFVTRPTTSSRVERAFLILNDEFDNNIEVKIKGLEDIFKIDRSKMKQALRTLTSVATFDVSAPDFILIDPPDDFDKILRLSKWEGSFDWAKHRANVRNKISNVVVGRRFRPNSNNTHHFAFYSSEGVVSPDTFKIINFKDNEEARIQSLILNSTITISNILSFREQTTGGFTDIRGSELVLFDIFNIDILSQESKDKLLSLFDRLRYKEFPSIVDQYVSTDKNRLALDIGILSSLGFTSEEATRMLYGVYDTVMEELRVKG